MDYQESKVYLEEISKYGSVLGLTNMKEMMRRLGNPQDSLKFIHISGTNGKGSALAYISTVLKEQGYQVGRYISPTLFTYEERIQVNETEIGKDALARLTTKVRNAAEEMAAEGKPHPTIFEVETALSFLYFQEMGCDYVVLETGLGGSEDATNIIQTTILEVITSISMDHMGFLGDALAEIAAQKAGIIKPHTVVVSQSQEPEAMAVIEQTAGRLGCELRKVDPSNIQEVEYGYPVQRFVYRLPIQIGLVGTYQIANAALAVEAVYALRTLGVEISQEALLRGMRGATWKGRFTILSEHPVLVMDGAHNEAAARELARSIEMYFKGRPIFYVMGVFADKEYDKIIEITKAYPERVITTQTPANPRALSAEELARAWRIHVAEMHRPIEITCEPDVKRAVRQAVELAGDEGVVITFGSLSFLSLVQEEVK